MEQQTKNLIVGAVETLAQATGIKVVYKANVPKTGNVYPDGFVRIDYKNMHWDFAIQTKVRVTRATVAIEKTQPTLPGHDRILVTEYATPPMADLMRQIGLLFMDTAGNAYINKPPLYIFIKGNKRPENLKPAPIKRLFKPAGLKVVFALLNNPQMVDWPYRQVAAVTDVALGTVDWIFRDLKEMGFLVEMGGRKRKITNPLPLLKRWVEAYPEQLRPKLGIERFKADDPNWWKNVDIADYNACWGGEVAAAKITKQLKPEKVIIYAPEPPGKLIIEKKLRKTATGDIEILKPFWKFDHKLIHLGIAPPLLIYADLMATGDDRNIETAEIIYDNYLAQPDRHDR
ncbi:MAG: hypothetical protein C4519_27595 [Desulfobacteraceae bacterium]|nr:MAG: hypothetical protein C4519_27595 [Desulfobacteraceae bacterium]